MKKSLKLILGISMVVGFLPNMVYAGPRKDPIDVWLDRCLDRNPSEAGMENCTYKAQQMWNARLNKVYGELMRKLNPKQREELKESERNWVRFVQSEKKFIYDFEPPFADAQLSGDDSVMDLYKQRALQLQGYLDDLKFFY